MIPLKYLFIVLKCNASKSNFLTGNIAFYEEGDTHKLRKLYGHIIHCLRPFKAHYDDHSDDIVVSMNREVCRRDLTNVLPIFRLYVH